VRDGNNIIIIIIIVTRQRVYLVATIAAELGTSSTAVARAIFTAAACNKRGATSRPSAESRHYYYYYRLPTVVGRSLHVVSPIPPTALVIIVIWFPDSVESLRGRWTPNNNDKLIFYQAHSIIFLYYDDRPTYDRVSLFINFYTRFQQSVTAVDARAVIINIGIVYLNNIKSRYTAVTCSSRYVYAVRCARDCRHRRVERVRTTFFRR